MTFPWEATVFRTPIMRILRHLGRLRTRNLGDWTLTSLTAFEGFNQSYGFDFDGGVALFGNPLFSANLSYDRNFRQYSQEVRLKTERDRRLHPVRGLYAAAEDFSQTYTIWCGELAPDTLLGTCPYVGALPAGPVLTLFRTVPP
jgi:iron complex outermembrane receptor protein